jgi:hypothetical protein
MGKVTAIKVNANEIAAGHHTAGVGRPDGTFTWTLSIKGIIWA